MLSKRVTVSNQVLLVWRQTMSQDSSPVQTLFVICLISIFHALLLTLPSRIKSTSTESMPKQESVRVRISPPKSSERSAQEEKPLESDAAMRRKSKKSTPQVLASERVESPSSDIPLVPEPQVEPLPSPKSAKPQSPSTLLEERQSPLLPSGKNDFIERQRKLGDTIGAGAIAGDLEVRDVVADADSSNPIRRTEYAFAGYFDSLSRRFVEAWGSVRTLPPQSRFDGKVGEFIEYDVVINRDGSLRKIVNISARREPFRDFTAVDELVMGVFKSMFPFQPIPDRIQNDPLVIRKRIQFVGFKYTLY